MKTFNINNPDFLDNEQEELKKSTNSENNDDFKKRFTKDFNNQMNNFQNTDLIGLKYFPEKKDKESLENSPNENNQKYVNDNKKKDISYYNQIINTLNKELGIVSDKLNNKNNVNIPKNSRNNINNKKYNNINVNKRKNKNHNNNKKEIMKENNSNKLTDLENNKIFLLNKNKEIEEQINNLQNLAQKVNLINEKNNYYVNNNNYVNLNMNINNDAYKDDKEDDQQYKNDFNNNLLMNDKMNYIINNNKNRYKIPENYSNILQDKNNYIQIEDDSIEPFFEEKKTNYNNFEYYNEDINNYRNFNNQIKKNNDNLKQIQPYYENYENNISSNSRNNKYNKLKKNKTFNQRKTHDDFRPKNIKLKSKKRKNSRCISNPGGGVVNNQDSKKIIKRINSYKNVISSSKEKRNKIKKKLGKNANKKMINEFKNNGEDLEYKFSYLKNIIGEMSSEKFDNNTKLFLINKVNELQIDFINKISSLEKKYKIQNDNNKKKINKLEKENNILRKKLINIKSIV